MKRILIRSSRNFASATAEILVFLRSQLQTKIYTDGYILGLHDYGQNTAAFTSMFCYIPANVQQDMYSSESESERQSICNLEDSKASDEETGSIFPRLDSSFSGKLDPVAAEFPPCVRAVAAAEKAVLASRDLSRPEGCSIGKPRSDPFVDGSASRDPETAFRPPSTGYADEEKAVLCVFGGAPRAVLVYKIDAWQGPCVKRSLTLVEITNDQTLMLTKTEYDPSDDQPDLFPKTDWVSDPPSDTDDDDPLTSISRLLRPCHVAEISTECLPAYRDTNMFFCSSARVCECCLISTTVSWQPPCLHGVPRYLSPDRLLSTVESVCTGFVSSLASQSDKTKKM
ncbi:uncharacterized protein LOC128602772 isoform X3 [Ictalurus furcatus]|uniref:uncharacterized protein LOC128602772 isoform X3 n=1 Tax=Ictalurus furcatus TaxID=66913 RepID=UPI002350FD8C|nr:uncharacterized protein LOC128602772 isoform X3 [Ictalurus furcatus]